MIYTLNVCDEYRHTFKTYEVCYSHSNNDTEHVYKELNNIETFKTDIKFEKGMILHYYGLLYTVLDVR